MTLRIRHIDPDATPSSQVSLETLALFKRICSKPLAEPETVPEAFLFGLRLMAVDGTVLDLPDTPENVRVFGKRHSPRGTSAWLQARVVAISECATHAVLEAE